MATVSATSLSFGSFSKQSIGTDLVTGRTSSAKRVSFGCTKKGFPSLRSSRFHVSCGAKPETIEKVIEIVRRQLVLPPDSELTPESTFAALGADSLDTVEIVMGLEEEFGINVEEDDPQNITTVKEAAEMIEKLIEKKCQA